MSHLICSLTAALVLAVAALSDNPAGAATEANPSPPTAPKPARPNVVIVMTDDQGLGDFSFTGNPVLKTPHLDAFARQAVRFTDFHVCPMCSPTRGELLTGLSALRNGATSVTAGRTFMRTGLPTLAEVFAGGGYQTGLFGKWHLGDAFPHRPADRGFHKAIYHLGWGQLHSTPEFDWPLFDGRYFDNGQPGRYQGHCTDFWFDQAMHWMRHQARAGQPFLCYIPTNAPHGPHIDLESDIAPYVGKGPAGFFGMIAHIDRRFGDLDAFLSAEGLRDNTILIFLTDNGGTAGVRIHNAGLRRGKTTYYEGGHRVPFWIRWPAGQLGQPRDIDTPAQSLDVLPTLCELCELPTPPRSAEDRPFTGTSLAGLLRGTQTTLPDRTLVVQYGQVPEHGKACVIAGPWRLVNNTELYNVATDRAQVTNLANEHPDKLAAMQASYNAWWAAVEPWVKTLVPIHIGAPQQPVVELTSGDWEGIYADNTGFVRAAVGGPNGGHWNIQVETPGVYQFTLRRWPQQTGVALGDAYMPHAKSTDYNPKAKTRGFPTIAQAKLSIAEQTWGVITDPRSTGAIITVKMTETGPKKLKAWFADAAGQDLCGAFFVTVERLDIPAAP